MPIAILKSRALNGMTAAPVTVEVHSSYGAPAVVMVGLAETEVREARDRVKAAIQNSGFEFPNLHITINLAPAELPKESSRFDLPIALGILAASGQIRSEGFDDYEFVGELSLSGELRAVNGILPITLALKAEGKRALLLPEANADEALLVSDVTLYPAPSLAAVTTFLDDPGSLQAAVPTEPHQQAHRNLTQDWGDIKGQAFAKRALEIAAAGGHSVLMSGPPGSGKSMLAQRFITLLPSLDEAEALESATICSLNGSFRVEHWRQRPYRAPHHTASAVALVGGGSNPRPGEISLAHHGVLFLDELPEFDRRVLEVLREPLESGSITISRAARQAEFPARFQLIAAMNPCPCGFLGHKTRRCSCTPDQVARYQGKISGPLLDRIDVQIEVPTMPTEDIANSKSGETSSVVAQRVAVARQRQIERQGKTNAALTVQEIDRVCQLAPASRTFLDKTFNQLGWSARAYHRILRLARSIADYAGSPDISHSQLAEAIQYRRLFRQ